METQEKGIVKAWPDVVRTASGNEFPVMARVLPSQIYARADHVARAIEVNADVYPVLDPLMREFVMCHEVCHLEWDDNDEARTTARACFLFIDRAVTPTDRQKRIEWLKSIGMDSERYSNIATEVIMAIVAAACVAVAATAAGVVAIVKGVRSRNIGWYSWDDAYKKEYLNRALTDAFNNAMQSDSSTARTFFWNDFAQYTAKDKNFDRFITRKGNTWVKQVIEKFEYRYGFGFDELYQAPDEDSPLPKIVVGVAVITLLVLLIMD